MSPLSSSDHVIVVGAGLAGWRFVEAARREGYQGALTLVGEESFAPYDRPPLSKQVLVGKWPLEHTILATSELIDKNNVEMLLGVRASGLDVAQTEVHLSDGRSLVGTHVVIATGARARRLPYSADSQLHTLRTRSDLDRLNRDLERLAAGSVVAVIGGGFIGAEVATALHTRGFHPVVLEVAQRPLVRVLGEPVSRWLVNLAHDVGVELRNDQHIVDVVKAGDNFEVMFEDGASLTAGVVIVGAGAQTNHEWLDSSGLTIENGVVVNEHLLATDKVAAIGDIARFQWHNTTGSELTRIEHWQLANDHAMSLAHYWMTGEPSSALLIPYFWSDQYGKKIQLLGHPRPDDDVVRVMGSEESGKWLAIYSRGGIVTGVVTLSQPRGLMLSKPLLENPTTLVEAFEQAPWAA